MKLKWNEASMWWLVFAMLCLKLKLIIPSVASETPHDANDIESESKFKAAEEHEAYHKQGDGSGDDGHVTKGSITLTALERCILWK